MMIDLEGLFASRAELNQESAYLRYKLKKIMYEHIKRRPKIDERMGLLQQSVWDKSQVHFPVGERKKQPLHGFRPKYTHEEIRIMNTPVEELMAAYEKSLE